MLLNRTRGGPETSLNTPLHPVKVTRGLLYIKLPMIYDLCVPVHNVVMHADP
jgi:hypothetical protein